MPNNDPETILALRRARLRYTLATAVQALDSRASPQTIRYRLHEVQTACAAWEQAVRQTTPPLALVCEAVRWYCVWTRCGYSHCDCPLPHTHASRPYALDECPACEAQRMQRLEEGAHP